MAHPSERLVNLTVALLEARRPLTFEEIRRKTTYYTQDDHESARRMFERDKDALRSLGVPIETRTIDVIGGEVGYIVDRSDYELPDVDLDPDEVAALALALQITGDDAARIGLAKVGARAPDPAGDRELRARIDIGASALDEVADAVVNRQPVQFTYRTVDGREADRKADPYAVVHRRGAWYVVARDHERDDVRSFRLDRVRGRFRAVGDAGGYEVPDDLDAMNAIGSHEDVDARLAIAPDATWEVEVRGGRATGETHAGWPVYALPHADRWRTLAWVLGLGPDAVVLEPPELRDEVVRRLTAVAGDDS
ncbi:MAG: WYL domain-containing protein [Nitriliruptorales bacterium]|nr:WYL domain-containing protein [Nitriliruptorales bacterium]